MLDLLIDAPPANEDPRGRAATEQAGAPLAYPVPMHQTTVEARIVREIEELHALLEGWFRGTVPAAGLGSRILSRMTDDFLYVLPGGSEHDLASLEASLRRAHGSNPDFEIAVRNVRVRHADARVAVAFYEEWQRGARNSDATNARVTTVLFAIDAGEPRWRHLQETWMPPDAVATGGPFR